MPRFNMDGSHTVHLQSHSKENLVFRHHFLEQCVWNWIVYDVAV